MNKTLSRRLGLAAVVVVTLILAVANPFGIRLWHPPTASADPLTPFGVSGGNANDISKAFCCSGTLGSLVKDSTGSLFILSNNHVLARSGAAVMGEPISQPGLVDTRCIAGGTVATLTDFPLLGSNVDAAIAQLTPGSPMDPNGTIANGIGTISRVPKKATVDLGVQKSGRTTARTFGTVSSVDTNVTVQYQARCGQGKKFTISYSNQVVITPDPVNTTFSAGGDSGSLIVTNNSDKQPVALLFAGSGTTTIANPICEVLPKVSATHGKPVSFVSDNSAGVDDCTTNASTPLPAPSRGHQSAHNAKDRYADELMSRPGVIGVGVGNTEDGKAAAVILYVDTTVPGPPFVPAQLDGVPVRVIRTDTFVSQ